ncbi:hypothetical protein KY358_00325 [Candidatus Woesearchaeota archaeon]|nr:hypothetical protein [Candidatus Woesearchaeota archaeon]
MRSLDERYEKKGPDRNFSKGQSYDEYKARLIQDIKDIDKQISYYRAESRYNLCKDVKILLPVICLLLLFILHLFSSLAPTGFVALDKQYNASENLNLGLNSSYSYIWAKGSPGDLMSFKIDGSVSQKGSAKVYLVSKNRSFLVMDSSILKKKQGPGLLSRLSSVVGGSVKKLNTPLTGAGSGPHDLIHFREECVETCLLRGMDSYEYTILFVIDSSSLKIDTLRYSTSTGMSIGKMAPLSVREFTNMTIRRGSQSTLNLSSYFYDPDGDDLVYSAYPMDNIAVSFKGPIATIAPDLNYTGTRYTFFTASDRNSEISGNLISIGVLG